MARTKQTANKDGATKSSKASASKTEPVKKEVAKATTKENKKPKTNIKLKTDDNSSDNDDFVEEKKVIKKKSSEETKVPAPKKQGLKKKKAAVIEQDSDPESNDLEAIIDSTHDFGKEIISLAKSSDLIDRAEALLDGIEKDNVSSDSKLEKLVSVFGNCLGSRHMQVLNQDNVFTRIHQMFEDLIEGQAGQALTAKVAKAVGLNLSDTIETPGHFQKGKKFASLQIEEDFESICKRLMRIM